LPQPLERAGGESLATWRDRLYQQTRIPTFLAALTDLKSAYLEIGNPLLARSVLECVRAMPDELRTDKPLWREIVGAQLPGVALAKRVAIPSVNDFLTDRRVLELLLEEVSSEHAARLLAPSLRARCSASLQAAWRAAAATGTVRRGEWRHSSLAAVVPTPVRAVLRNWQANRRTIDPLVLAFRAFVAVRMDSLLRADAARRSAEREPTGNAA
jgi:hypothetical protein